MSTGASQPGAPTQVQGSAERVAVRAAPVRPRSASGTRGIQRWATKSLGRLTSAASTRRSLLVVSSWRSRYARCLQAAEQNRARGSTRWSHGLRPPRCGRQAEFLAGQVERRQFALEAPKEADVPENRCSTPCSRRLLNRPKGPYDATTVLVALLVSTCRGDPDGTLTRYRRSSGRW